MDVSRETLQEEGARMRIFTVEHFWDMGILVNLPREMVQKMCDDMNADRDIRRELAQAEFDEIAYSLTGRG